MRLSITPGTLLATTNHAIAGLLALSLLVLSEAASARDAVFLELPGLERAEVISLKLGDGTPVQTGIAGRCDPAKEKIIVDREFGQPLSTAVTEAVVRGTSFAYVVVYRNNAQFWLHDVLITSYSVGGTVGGGLIESFTLEVANITVQPE